MINVNAVAPTFIETDGTAHIDLSHAPGIAKIAAEDVGRAVAWLAANPRREHAGRRFNAAEFPTSWGQ